MGLCLYMLTLKSSKSRIVCLLIFKVNQDSLGDVILLTLQGVSITDVQEGLKFYIIDLFNLFCLTLNNIW